MRLVSIANFAQVVPLMRVSHKWYHLCEFRTSGTTCANSAKRPIKSCFFWWIRIEKKMESGAPRLGCTALNVEKTCYLENLSISIVDAALLDCLFLFFSFSRERRDSRRNWPFSVCRKCLMAHSINRFFPSFQLFQDIYNFLVLKKQGYFHNFSPCLSGFYSLISCSDWSCAGSSSSCSWARASLAFISNPYALANSGSSRTTMFIFLLVILFLSQLAPPP